MRLPPNHSAESDAKTNVSHIYDTSTDASKANKEDAVLLSKSQNYNPKVASNPSSRYPSDPEPGNKACL
jgi:hypothetical protein